jgi:hypothetical protein
MKLPIAKLLPILSFLLVLHPFAAHAEEYDFGFSMLFVIGLAVLEVVVTLALILSVFLRVYLVHKGKISSLVSVFLRIICVITGALSSYMPFRVPWSYAPGHAFMNINALSNTLLLVAFASVGIAAVGVFPSDQWLTRLFKK